MTKYIEIEEAEKAFREAFKNPSEMGNAQAFINILRHDVPAADVKLVVRGEWIVKQTAIGKDYTVCSVCKTDFKFKTDKGTLARLDMRGMSYCPNCGADMRKEVNDDTEK